MKYCLYQIISCYVPTGATIFGKKYDSLEDVLLATEELNKVYDNNNFPMHATYLEVE